MKCKINYGPQYKSILVRRARHGGRVEEESYKPHSGQKAERKLGKGQMQDKPFDGTSTVTSFLHTCCTVNPSKNQPVKKVSSQKSQSGSIMSPAEYHA